MKKVVVPGELITNDTKVVGEGLYKGKEGLYSKYLGVVYDSEFGVKVVPLNGKYAPKVGDIIIGKIISNEPFVYLVDVCGYKIGVLSKRSLETSLSLYDVVLLKVADVNEVRDVSLSLIKKLYGGELFKIGSKKTARVIGKAKSMLSLIESYTKSRLVIGANGLIYAIDGDLIKVRDVLKLIEEYSHVDNLTDKVELYFENKSKE